MPAPSSGRDLPWWTRAQALRALIALAAIPGSLLILGAVWIARGAQEGHALGQILQAVMLTGAGFYFGGLGAERAEQQARTASQEAVKLRTVSAVTAASVEEAEREVSRMLEVLDRLSQDPVVGRKVKELMKEVNG